MELIKKFINDFRDEETLKEVNYTSISIDFCDKLLDKISDMEREDKNEKEKGKESLQIEYYSLFKKKPFG